MGIEGKALAMLLAHLGEFDSPGARWWCRRGGQIVEAGWREGCGMLVVIRHADGATPGRISIAIGRGPRAFLELSDTLERIIGMPGAWNSARDIPFLLNNGGGTPAGVTIIRQMHDFPRGDSKNINGINDFSIVTRAGADNLRETLNLTALSDVELQENLKRLATLQNQCTAVIVAHLLEWDERELSEKASFPSLFSYCTKVLGFSEDVACRHALAVKAAKRFPSVLHLLARGDIHLTAISILNRHLTSENHRRLLSWASGKSRRELERRAAELEGRARPAPREVIRHLPRTTVQEQAPDPARMPFFDAPHPPPVRPPGAASGREPSPATSGFALSPGAAVFAAADQPLLRFAFNSSEAFLLKIEKIKGLLRHKYPAGRLEDIMGELAEFFLTRSDPALKTMPARRLDRAVRKRRIPRWVKDEVFKRDGGRCVYLSDSGRRCEETGGLEYDHIKPWARGGISEDPANVRLLCRAHNQFLARRAFGKIAVAEAITRRRVALCGRRAPEER